MPASTLVKQYKLTDIEEKLVNIILDDTFRQLKQVLRIETALIRKIVIHKLVELTT